MVVHLGPDPAGSGGMPAVLRSLLSSPLAARYDLRVIPTHRSVSAVGRVVVFAAAVRELTRLLRTTSGPRIVHLHATVRGSLHRKAMLVGLARRFDVPVVLHVHSGAGDLAAFHGRLDPLRRLLFRRALRAAQVTLSVSAPSARELERCFGARGVKLLDNPLPGPLPPIEPRTETGAVEVLYLGGFANPVKGGAVLVAALPLICADPRVEVVLAGPGRPPAEATAAGARWAGWLDESAKARALHRAEVFVIPSTSEGLPMALLEAMAHGQAIVATRVGAIADVIDDGRDGVVVEPGDPRALADAVLALAADSERRRRLGAAARARAADFAPEHVADRIDGIYRAVLAREAVAA